MFVLNTKENISIDKNIFVIANTEFYDYENFNNSGDFKSIKEKNEMLIKSWNKEVGAEDIVIHIGGFCGRATKKEINEIVKQLNGELYLIHGPKDDQFTRCIWEASGFTKCVPYQYFLNIQGKKILLGETTPDSSFDIHCVGDIDNVIEGNNINISSKFWDYTPINIEELPEIFERLKELEEN